MIFRLIDNQWDQWWLTSDEPVTLSLTIDIPMPVIVMIVPVLFIDWKVTLMKWLMTIGDVNSFRPRIEMCNGDIDTNQWNTNDSKYLMTDDPNDGIDVMTSFSDDD